MPPGKVWQPASLEDQCIYRYIDYLKASVNNIDFDWFAVLILRESCSGRDGYNLPRSGIREPVCAVAECQSRNHVPHPGPPAHRRPHRHPPGHREVTTSSQLEEDQLLEDHYFITHTVIGRKVKGDSCRYFQLRSNSIDRLVFFFLISFRHTNSQIKLIIFE